MKKGKHNYEDELYDDDEYYDDDDYYDDDYYYEEEEEEEKPKKNTKKNNSNKNKSNQTNNQFQSKQQIQNKSVKTNKNQNNNNNLNLSKKESSNNTLNLSKKESNISNISSSLGFSAKPSSSSSISNSIKEIKKQEKEKEKQISITALNNIKTYPKIDYGKKYTSNDNSDEKPTINLVIIGHVDSGKSTIVGHLLCLLNVLDKKQVHKDLKVKSNKGEKEIDTLAYAFATDEASDERERGVTIETAFKTFSTKNKTVIAIDAPGHQDFIPSMIAGTSVADVALLVIDSGINAFDAGFYKDGQTKEHALLAKTLGISHLIVAINKLELFNWKKERFDEIKEALNHFLIDELGFDENNLKFLPTSGLTGDNLIKPISEKSGDWYKGPTLIDLIDSLESPQRAIDSPVRFIINDIAKNNKGCSIFGKLENGIIINNYEYIILPSGNKEKIKIIVVNKKNVNFITPGQQAELFLQTNKNLKEEQMIEPGNVLCLEKYPIPCIKKFKAHIKTYELKIPISLGQKMMFYLQGQKTQISIKKIERIFNEGSKVSKNNTRFIPKNFYADIIIESENKICAELYVVNNKLSTFALRISGDTQAMGYITEFLE